MRSASHRQLHVREERVRLEKRARARRKRASGFAAHVVARSPQNSPRALPATPIFTKNCSPLHSLAVEAELNGSLHYGRCRGSAAVESNTATALWTCALMSRANSHTVLIYSCLPLLAQNFQIRTTSTVRMLFRALALLLCVQGTDAYLMSVDRRKELAPTILANSSPCRQLALDGATMTLCHRMHWLGSLGPAVGARPAERAGSSVGERCRDIRRPEDAYGRRHAGAGL